MTSQDRCSAAASSWVCWCSLALLGWATQYCVLSIVCPLAGASTVGSLVNQEDGKLQFSTPASHITAGVSNSTNDTSYEESTIALDCGKNSHYCMGYCKICHGYDRKDCLADLIDHFCCTPFHQQMAAHNTSDWCVWSNVRSAYNNFTVCTEELAECLLIPWPNALVEGIFLKVHAFYFHTCPTEELSDPPPNVVFALVMTPICLIPIMVLLVMLKSKNADGS